MKYLLAILGVAVVGALGLVIDAQSRVPVQRPSASTQRPRIFATGRIEGLTSEIELRPQLVGRIERIEVGEGQWVEQGDVLVSLDDQQYRCEVEVATAELNLAKARLERLQTGARAEERQEAAALHRARLAELHGAQLVLERINRLRGSNIASQEEAETQNARVEALTADVAAAKARVELLEAPPRPDEVRMDEARVQAAEARLGLAQVELERAKLLAPVRSQVLKVDARVGELAGPESPLPIVILADTSHFRVRAFLEELDAPQVRSGLPVKVMADGLPGREFRGRVSHFSPRMGRKELWSDQPAERYDTKTREVWIDLDDAAELVVGLRVDVVIELDAPRSGSPSSTSAKPAVSEPVGGRPPRPSPRISRTDARTSTRWRDQEGIRSRFCHR